MANTIEQRLQALYAGCGYQPFRVKKFERYELYSENRRFLTTEKVLTFTNTDGRLMAMKPDVTLSIVQDTQPEGLRKVFYRENVYREQRPGEGFREIPQTGLECIGALDAAAAEYYDLPQGLYVESVAEGSDAEKQGIQPGDIVTAVNGQTVSTTFEVNAIKEAFSVGDTMTLTIYRDGETFDVTVTLMDTNDVY